MDENVLDKDKIEEVTNPQHYKGNIECIDAMQQQNGEKMTLKCIESYRIVKKRLLEQINEAAGKE